MADETEGNVTDQRPARHSAPSSDSWKAVFAVVVVAILAAIVLDKSPVVARAQERSTPDSMFDDVAIMGAVKRSVASENFKRGEATAVMGGVDIDLRGARMEGPEAVLDVSSVMGGVKIRVPEDWLVVSRVETVLGGFEDRTRHPRDDKHRLILEGTVFMGGLKVQN